MRAALREAASVPTSVGRLSLSMSVGVHSGDVALFLVGSPTRELRILGPAASAPARAEKVAHAGEGVVRAATAARLSPGSTRPRDDGELLLRRRAAHSPPGPPAPVPPGSDALLHTLFPVELGAYLAPGPPDPEHRIATHAEIVFPGLAYRRMRFSLRGATIKGSDDPHAVVLAFPDDALATPRTLGRFADAREAHRVRGVIEGMCR
jgi:hypothetical protein